MFGWIRRLRGTGKPNVAQLRARHDVQGLLNALRWHPPDKSIVHSESMEVRILAAGALAELEPHTAKQAIENTVKLISEVVEKQ